MANLKVDSEEATGSLSVRALWFLDNLAYLNLQIGTADESGKGNEQEASGSCLGQNEKENTRRNCSSGYNPYTNSEQEAVNKGRSNATKKVKRKKKHSQQMNWYQMH